MRRSVLLPALIFIALSFLIYALIPRPPLLDGVDFSRAVYDRHGKLLRLTLAGDGLFRLREPLIDISPALISATLLHEDRHFRTHPGVNPYALGRAFVSTYLKGDGGRRVGGSTITMQLARVRYGIKSRTITGKFYQILKAVQLERHYSKNEILEAYLNLVPYGGNVVGVGAASLVYFNKDAYELTLEEALTLAVIPQSPARRSPRGLTDSENKSLVLARSALYDKWIAAHPEDAGRNNLLSLPMSVGARSTLPFLGPHFVDALLKDDKNRDLIKIRSTLDMRLQRVLESRAASYIERKRNEGLSNTSAMLLDYRTMEVLAVLGSVDFFDNAIEGQVNGTIAKRSPGSTLKPMIYGLAMDQGLIHPLTMLKDSPTGFGEYSPENFDHEFEGPIKAKDALIRSRNIPALSLANRLSGPDLYGFLEKASVSDLRTREFYGLALVLGGAEMTMEELVRLYAMLANRGIFRPLRTLKDSSLAKETAGQSRRLLSAEAAYLALDILKANPRPNRKLSDRWAVPSMPVYWKTGTSYGYRDAWSIAVTGPYVLAVWVGNFNGEGNPAYKGRGAAAPLMFEMIDAISDMNLEPAGFSKTPPEKITELQVCAISGYLPSPHCN